MPNYSENTLTITGNNEDVMGFIKASRGFDDKGNIVSKFSFNSLVPTPEIANVEKQLKWNNKNWGTKWEADLEELAEWRYVKETGEYNLSFDTAWTPPTKWVKKVAKMFPTLSFVLDYISDGGEFAGICEAEGKYFSDEEIEYVNKDVCVECDEYTWNCECN